MQLHGGAAALWLSPWLMVALYVAAFRGRATRRFFGNIWITTIGGMCYTIYLLHNYLIAGIGMATERVLSSSWFDLRLAVQFLLITPAVLVVSALFFRWIERPCMRPDWPQRLKAAFTSSAPAPYRALASSTTLSPEE
jgi:peptidoglycan/LPS O-acetylase OafA/YrhL